MATVAGYLPAYPAKGQTKQELYHTQNKMF